ncbi:MAG: thiamine diphosphokinase [Candidatus Limnocylindria bacterium]
MTIVVAAGELDPTDLRLLDRADLVIAADGGAALLDHHGRTPDLLVGDLDSVEPRLVERLVAAGTRVERHPVDKDASDTELAVAAAMSSPIGPIRLLGAFGGGRLDHELANVFLLADPALAGRDIRAVRGASTVRAFHSGGRLAIDAPRGSLVTLLPVRGDVTGVTTEGLRWSLQDAVLRFGRSRGLSNEVTGEPASIRIGEGTLLVIETRREGGTQ